MTKSITLWIVFAAAFCSTALAQVSGRIVLGGQVSSGTPPVALPNASILVKGTNEGAITDSSGEFSITVSRLPVTLVISSQGFETQEIRVLNQLRLAISLQQVYSPLNAVVVAPNRIPTRLINSPVSIETVSLNQIRLSPSSSYYDAAAYLKGIDRTTSGMLFSTISTRGFNNSGNTRFNQLMDGMDNQAPGLNFSVGAILGLPELDVESMEILPGASSALYGPGGMNGTLMVNSRNPFQSEGLSLQLKTGIMHIDRRERPEPSAFQDYSLRWARAFNNRFAFKLNVQYIKADDWRGSDTSNYLRALSGAKVIPGTRATDPNYDGINVYGDETSVDVRQFVGAIGSSFPPGDPLGDAILAKYASMSNPTLVSRTGYYESDIADPTTFNFKISGGLYYKIRPDLELSLTGHWGNGSTVYTGTDRYNLKNVKMGQYKLELKQTHWFLRVYTTQEDAGQSYSLTGTARIMNEVWKPSYDPNDPMGSWYFQYAQAFIGASLQGADDASAHHAGRLIADTGRPVPGSSQFKSILNQVRSIPISQGGGLFLDKSDMWMAEGQYHLDKQIRFADVIVGGNFKRYLLNSQGTIFIDTAGRLSINEWGGYMQISKSLIGDRLTLSASGRYDKNANFKGRFTPRATLLVKVAENNNLRFSYQTAYRFPSTQQQYIKLEVTDPILLGGLPWITEWLHSDKIPTYQATGSGIVPWNYQALKPETVQSYEAGYKSVIKKRLMIDMYAYWANYHDFLGRIALVQPSVSASRLFAIVVNSSTRVKTHGAGAGFSYQLPGHYSLFANWYNDNISKLPSGFQALFNTPRNRVNAGFANSGLGRAGKLGFNIMGHWQQSFFFENDFAQGTVPAYFTLDAQVSYKLTKSKSLIKIGATNLFNHYYQNGFGNPAIGGLYYVSLGFRVL